MMIWVHWKLVRLTSFRVCCLQIVIVHFYVADSKSDPLLWLQSSLSFALNEGIMSSFSATLLWQKSEIKNKDILHTYQTTAWTFMAFDYHKNGYNQLVHFHNITKIVSFECSSDPSQNYFSFRWYHWFPNMYLNFHVKIGHDLNFWRENSNTSTYF